MNNESSLVSEERPTINTWAACLSASFLMLGLAGYFVRFVKNQGRVFSRLEIKVLPVVTEHSLALGPYFSVLVIAAVGWGIRILRTRDRSTALSWFLWSLLLTITAQTLLTEALVLPLQIIMRNLSR